MGKEYVLLREPFTGSLFFSTPFDKIRQRSSRSRTSDKIRQKSTSFVFFRQISTAFDILNFPV